MFKELQVDTDNDSVVDGFSMKDSVIDETWEKRFCVVELIFTTILVLHFFSFCTYDILLRL
jgi:hypothetical protein